MRYLIALLITAMLATSAHAGRGRCRGNCSWQTYESSHGWTNSCYKCHPNPHASKKDAATAVAEGLTEVAETVAAFKALDKGLNALGYSAQAYGMPNYQVSGVTYAEQGPALYADGYNSQVATLSQVDIGAQMARAARLVENAQKLAGQSNMDLNTTIQSLGEQQARSLEIAVKGQAVTSAFRALDTSRPQPQFRAMTFHLTDDGQLSVEPSSQATVSSSEGQVQGQVQALGGSIEQADIQDPVAAAAREAVLGASCVGCHSPQKKSGGLDLTPEGVATWYASPQRKEILDKIYERVTSADPKQRMPLGPDNTEGVPLPLGEKRMLTDWH